MEAHFIPPALVVERLVQITMSLEEARGLVACIGGVMFDERSNKLYTTLGELIGYPVR